MIFKEIMDKILPLQVTGVKKSAVETILYGDKKYLNGDVINGYQGFLDKESINMDIDEYKFYTQLKADIEVCCKRYTSSKKSIITVFKELIKELKKYEIYLKLDEPKFDYTNEIERQLFLLKYLHPQENHTIGEACDELWMYSEDKIREDIFAIRNGKLNFLGKKINVEFTKNGTDVKFPSTAHPIILLENLTQIIVQLEGLRQMANGPLEKYALNTAKEIWDQLSEYAKERAYYVLEELVEVDTKFYDTLESMDKKEVFVSEYDCSHIKGVSSVINFLKNGQEFYIAYNENDKTIKRRCRIDQYKNLETLYLIDTKTNEKFTLDSEQVICAAKNKKEFIKYLG